MTNPRPTGCLCDECAVYVNDYKLVCTACLEGLKQERDDLKAKVAEYEAWISRHVAGRNRAA